MSTAGSSNEGEGAVAPEWRWDRGRKKPNDHVEKFGVPLIGKALILL
jgi:hypothetical protein